MYQGAEVAASIAFGVIMVLLSLVGMYQAAVYAARLGHKGEFIRSASPTLMDEMDTDVLAGPMAVCYELEAAPVPVHDVEKLASAQERQDEDLWGVGAWYG
jgi:hypothetical protein